MMYASVIDSNGKIVAAFVDYGKKVPALLDDTPYGIITSDGQVTSKNGDPYTMFTVWTGEETTVYVDGDKVSDLTKGALSPSDKSANDTYTQSTGSSDFTVLDGTQHFQGPSDRSERLQRGRPDHYLAKCTEAGRRRYVEDGKITKKPSTRTQRLSTLMPTTRPRR